MNTKTIKPFYTIIWDFNSDQMGFFDVMPYFVNCWKEQKKRKNKTWNTSLEDKDKDRTKMPETFDEFKTFVLSNAQYQFWSRCEYECIVTGWPVQKNEHKLDVYEQIKANVDVVTQLFIENVK